MAKHSAAATERRTSSGPVSGRRRRRGSAAKGTAADAPIPFRPSSLSSDPVETLPVEVPAPAPVPYASIRALADIGVTPLRAFGLYELSTEYSAKRLCHAVMVRVAVEEGFARTLYESFGLLVVLVTSEEAFGDESVGDVLAIAWQRSGSEDVFPEVRQIGFAYPQAKGMYDLVDIRADGADLGFVERVVERAHH